MGARELLPVESVATLSAGPRIAPADCGTTVRDRASLRRAVARRDRLSVHPPDPGPIRRDRRDGHRPPQPLPAVSRGDQGRLSAPPRSSVLRDARRRESTTRCSSASCSTASRCASTRRSTCICSSTSATRTSFQMAYLDHSRRAGAPRSGPPRSPCTGVSRRRPADRRACRTGWLSCTSGRRLLTNP